MNKIFFTITLGLLLIGSQAFGQAFQKGDKIINLGIGLVGLGVNATGEYGITENIGVGAFVGYERNSFGYGYVGLTGGNYNRSEITVGARGAFHAGELLKLGDKFDPYLAAGAGVNLYTDPYWSYDLTKRDYVSKSYVLPTFLFRLGARYYFSPKMGAFGEIGTGGSWLSGGISLKL
jgi:hypothetical protein